jgi:hypothetical protein
MAAAIPFAGVGSAAAPIIAIAWRRLREIIRARDGLIRLFAGFSGQTMIQFN